MFVANGVYGAGAVITTTTNVGTSTGTSLVMEFTFNDYGALDQAFTVTSGSFVMEIRRVRVGADQVLRLSLLAPTAAGPSDAEIPPVDYVMGPAGVGGNLGRYLLSFTDRIGSETFMDVWKQGTTAPVASIASSSADVTWGSSPAAVEITSADALRSPWCKPWVRTARPSNTNIATMFAAGSAGLGDAFGGDGGTITHTPPDGTDATTFTGAWSSNGLAFLGIPEWYTDPPPVDDGGDPGDPGAGTVSPVSILDTGILELGVLELVLD